MFTHSHKTLIYVKPMAVGWPSQDYAKFSDMPPVGRPYQQYIMVPRATPTIFLADLDKQIAS